MTHLQTVHEKLSHYHREAEVYRNLPKTPWRTRAAESLRALANSLEREATPKVGGRTFG
ncbi:hypothetical protein BH24DEI2_BH24DEI2_07690 [soil metagenome]